MRLFWMVGLTFIAILLGCEREKRTAGPIVAETSATVGKSAVSSVRLVDEAGWLYRFGKNAEL